MQIKTILSLVTLKILFQKPNNSVRILHLGGRKTHSLISDLWVLYDESTLKK